MSARTESAEPRELTERQFEIFEYIYNFARDNGFQPSFREIIQHFGIGSPNAITGHLKALARKGWIDYTQSRAGYQSRAVRFLRRPDGTPFDGFADKPAAD